MTRNSTLSMFSTLSVLAMGLATGACAQTHVNLLPTNIDASRTVVLAGNTRPEAVAQNDLGLRPDSTPIAGLQMVLHRSDSNQAAFESYLAELNDPKSAHYHKWLTKAEIGDTFGPTKDDLNSVSRWLTDQGFTVGAVSPDGLTLEFDGTAGLVRSAFHAPIHNLSVNGEAHFANMRDPELPAALLPVVSGIASLNDFKPHALNHPRVAANVRGVPAGNAGQGEQYLGAADLATIYNFNPLLKAGITGKGVTIAVVEDTDQYNLGDWSTFRSVFGLDKAYPEGTLIQTTPKGTSKCKPAGFNGDDVEAAIDVDWASAAAPNAAIVSAACKDTTQFGGFLALANLLEEKVPPQVVSISYGEAESILGATENLYIRNLYSTAAAEGVTLFVSSGDEGAASANADQANANHGISVSGFTSTPYNISVGGTDFATTYLDESAAYFSSTDKTNFRSALSYVPEIPWNDSCAGNLLANFFGYNQSAGAAGFCNSKTGANFLTTAAGSGGPSGCATGDPNKLRVVGGSCAGYAKPIWQNTFGVPTDGVRDIPDVSLFASNGFWQAYYAVCISDPNSYYTGDPGFGACGTNPANFPGFGGTSISSPIWAGIQALVDQSTGMTWGNSNPILYTLASEQYGLSGDPSCNSTLGSKAGAKCIFYDVTLGDMAVNCTGKHNCYTAGGDYGVLSVGDKELAPAYSAGPGWDFATGIGTTNAANLVNRWTTFASGSTN